MYALPFTRHTREPNLNQKPQANNSLITQNKTNSAVQVIHKSSGVVVKCQATRSRSQNEKIARQLLADKVEAREKGDQSRVALKAEAARKKKASKVKKAKRKYRALEKGEGEEVGGKDGVEEYGDEHDHEVAESGGKGPSSV